MEGLTKLKRLELVSREAKQAENLRKLLLAIADDVRVLLIKLADRLHNMRTLEFVPPASRRRIAEETLDIYAPLAGRMGMQEMREEFEDLKTVMNVLPSRMPEFRKGFGIAMRDGEGGGVTLRHLHLHAIIPQNTEKGRIPVNFGIG